MEARFMHAARIDSVWTPGGRAELERVLSCPEAAVAENARQ